LAHSARNIAKKYGFKIASAGIAQACLESGYGTGVYNDNRNKVINPYTGEWRHNYFGMKYRPNRVNCHCGYFSSSGTEQHADGSYTPTTTDWYMFASLEKCVEGYYQFINIANYAKVKAATDPLTYFTE
jgi:Muramidase (flagellum-specific)